MNNKKLAQTRQVRKIKERTLDGFQCNLRKWYDQGPEFGDKMCSWILTDETNKLIVTSNIRHPRHSERPNPSFDIPQQIKGGNAAVECQIIPTNKNNLSPNIKNKIKQTQERQYTTSTYKKIHNQS